MLKIGYSNLTFAKVIDMNDFFLTKLPEVSRIRSMIGNIKVMFSVTNDRMMLEMAQEDRVYRISVLDKDVAKTVLGWFVYIPKDHRIDLYTADNPLEPLIQWKDKKPKFKNYPKLLDRAGLDKIFTRIINVS